jgi:SprT-like family
VFSEVKSKTLQNTVSKMLNKLFGSTDVINLDILEGNLSAGVDADTRNAGSSGGFQRVEVTLNTSELQNASKEFIASTILHEIIHGVFLIKNKNPLIDDHNEMGSYYISIMADALREMYPAVSSDDATALS